MKRLKKIYIIVFTIQFIVIANTSCKKFLEARSDNSLIVPKTISDFRGLLHNDIMNYEFSFDGIPATDDVFFTYNDWLASGKTISSLYIWDDMADHHFDWEFNYTRIRNANIILSGMKGLKDRDYTMEEYNQVIGAALFIRAFNFYDLSQYFSPPYTTLSTGLELGIPLKTSANAEDKTIRSTVQETYDRIISDLKESASLLPVYIGNNFIPAKEAAYAMLARTYLIMGKYDSSLKYANLCLERFNTLLNYNSGEVKINDNKPFPEENPEILYYGVARSVAGFNNRQMVDTALYNSFHQNDLRRSAYFRSNSGYHSFKGNYNTFTSGLFAGIAVDEIYLIRAECYARLGNTNGAMDDLNKLLQTRWITGTFIPFTVTNAADALTTVLQERRKELVFRPGLRWSDLKRLNLDNSYAKTIERNLDGNIYSLIPNDLRYTLLIPANEIEISRIKQNPR